MQAIHNIRESWRLLQSDDSLETVVALVIAIWTLGPSLWKIWKVRRAGGD